MYCKNCGNTIKEGASFCTQCGMQLEPDKSNLIESKTEEASVSNNKDKYKGTETPKKNNHKIVRIFLIFILIIVSAGSGYMLRGYVQPNKTDPIISDADFTKYPDYDKQKNDTGVVLSELVTALKQNDINKVAQYIKPEIRDDFISIINENKDKISQLADAIANSRMKFLSTDTYVYVRVAEYTYTLEGNEYILQFEKQGDKWLISGF